MRIAIEAQRIFRTNKHGMDFVALESIRELQKSNKENEYFIFVSPGEDHCLEETDNVHIIEVKCPTYPLWEQVALPRNVSKIKPDLLHCTSNTAPLNCPVPLVLTLHDIIFLEPVREEINLGIKTWVGIIAAWWFLAYSPNVGRSSQSLVLNATAYVRHCDYPRIKSQLSIMDIVSTFIPCQRYHLLPISILIMTIIFFPRQYRS